MMGHTWYYHRFIRRYANIIAPMKNILKKLDVFEWTSKCDKVFDILKENLNTTPILIFMNWKNEFNVHVDTSGIG
jgi:hypothetical protein